MAFDIVCCVEGVGAGAGSQVLIEDSFQFADFETFSVFFAKR